MGDNANQEMEKMPDWLIGILVVGVLFGTRPGRWMSAMVLGLLLGRGFSNFVHDYKGLDWSEEYKDLGKD